MKIKTRMHEINQIFTYLNNCNGNLLIIIISFFLRKNPKGITFESEELPENTKWFYLFIY